MNGSAPEPEYSKSASVRLHPDRKRQIDILRATADRTLFARIFAIVPLSFPQAAFSRSMRRAFQPPAVPGDLFPLVLTAAIRACYDIHMRLVKHIKARVFKPLCAFAAKTNQARAFPRVEDIPYNTELFIPIPTYDGSFQAVHPDIICTDALQGKTPGTPRFILAFTPYPFSIDTFENPSVLVSNDGINFTEEFPGLNPLAPPPATDHNDDPDIFFEDGFWRVIYLETLRPAEQNLRMLESRDRKNWSGALLLRMELNKDDWRGSELFMLSPAFIKNTATGQRFIYYVNMQKGRNTLEYMPAAAGCRIDRADRRFPDINLALDGGGELNPWHIDILQNDGVYYMLLTAVSENASGKTYSLFLSKSADLSSWTKPEPLIGDSYRASGFFSGGDLYVFFSREMDAFPAFPSPLKIWRIGVYKTTVA